MNRQRFEFALERLGSGDWAKFEHFASAILVHDYGQLRSTATPSGNLGRDAELFSPDGDPTVMLQFSVTKNWIEKIRKTAVRIRDNFHNASILVYVTNHQIGAGADDLKKELRKDHKIVLDIHDRSWFLDRVDAPPARTPLAEKLATEVVDPYLAGKKILESKAPALSEYESKAAVLHLQLQWEDDTREKGLTKLSFEALIKSVLRGTSSDNRLKTQFVRDAIHNLLPNHSRDFSDTQVNSALDRLDRRSVRHWRQTDEVCLNHEEASKVRDGLAQKEIKDQSLQAEIVRVLQDYFETPPLAEHVNELAIRVRRILDRFLLNKGEEFAAAVAQGRTMNLKDDALDLLVTKDFGEINDPTGQGADAVSAVRLALQEVLQRSSSPVQQYLREIADGYTLFGFLRAVPDVQKAVQKIFSSGEIWLDTSVLLPVMAETLLFPEEQIASRLLRAALDAGIKLQVTSGVVEEVERHINRCRAYSHTTRDGTWVGGVPFLYAMFSLSGHHPGGFLVWSDNFCGKERPKDDIIDYLRQDWGVKVHDLNYLVQQTPQELRWEVDRIWREAHELRRNTGFLEYDAYVIDRLVKHDVECFLGVIALRKSEATNELGHVHWWMTFDKTVRDFESKLRESMGQAAPKTPVMSPDFLANYLAVGPVRAQLDKATESSLPVAMFDMIADHVPAELLEIADAVRKEYGANNERLIRRKLRDSIDWLKRKRGELAKGGFNAVRENMERTLRARLHK